MAVIDRMTPEGRKLMAELDKLKELAAYVGFQSGTPAKEREEETEEDTSSEEETASEETSSEEESSEESSSEDEAA